MNHIGLRGALQRVRVLIGTLLCLVPIMATPATVPPLPGTATIMLLAPKTGAEIAAPGPVVIEAEAVDPLGDIRHLDFYANETWIGASDYLLKIAVIPGRPIPHRLEWKNVSPGTYKLSARGKDTGGREVVSPPVVVEVTTAQSANFMLVPKGAAWRWLYDGVDQKEGWRMPAFDAGGWKEGKAQLGFGEGDEATTIWIGKAPFPVTAYFRTEFQVPADAAFARLLLSLRRDDGAVVYLNGKEVVRDNMPTGTITAATLASSATEGGEFREFGIPASGLVPGRNVLAVEVHQYAVTSSDLSFDLQLTGVFAPVLTTPVVSIEATAPSTSEPAPTIRVAPGRLTVKRTGSTTLPLPVFVQYGGTAQPKLDYAALPNVVEIPASKSEVTLEVIAVDDDLDEPNESVVAKLQSSPMMGPIAGYTINEKLASAEVTIHDTDQPPVLEARLEITKPASGDRFRSGETIFVRAVATDPKGYVSRVEFFDGDRSIGVSEIVFIRAPDPGTPIEHALEWKGASDGGHKLWGKATSSSGATLVSAPVGISVGLGTVPVPVVVAVSAVIPEATEPSTEGGGKGGAVVVKRASGPSDVALTVAYRVSGSASNGVDFSRLSGVVTMARGQNSAEIPIRPLKDALKEGDEKVLISLLTPACPAIYPPPAECYHVGAPSEAVVVIHDAPALNAAPRVAVTSPKNGAVFATGETIVIQAEASDADGSVARLDILADGKVLGSTKGGALKIEWKDAAKGMYRLTARAVDDLGKETVSSAVKIHVRNIAGLAFVRRELPPAYLPGGGVEVALNAEPPKNARAWAVEETPPAGWTVEVQGEEGFFDKAAGVIRYGPFTDAKVRKLGYKTTAPNTATGPQKFQGTSSLDGKTLPILGSDTLQPAGEYHPADASPADHRISIDELTAYAAAWKAGKGWGANEAAIPASYLTRAGAIWRAGGKYTFAPAKGAPPECWVPASGAVPGLASVSVGETDGAGSAERTLPAAWVPGVAGSVQVRVVPPPGAAATAVEETVPEGWTVTRVSHDGSFDPVNGRVRWGLLDGATPRELTYDLVPPADVASNGKLSGSLSIDGLVFPVLGREVVGAAGGAASVRITGSRRGERGHVRFGVEAPPDQVFSVEASSDLRTWVPIESFVYTGEELEIHDPASETAEGRYYRLRPVGP